MANPRIDDLRSRLQREPGSRLFAQLAEELRKDGDLPEAIRVARSGLALHPNYPSARLTLGRALIESGNLTGARSELESVLRGAPDNILASRMLAECLEGLGDLGAALLQFRAALRLNPGDRQIEGADSRPGAKAGQPASGPAHHTRPEQSLGQPQDHQRIPAGTFGEGGGQRRNPPQTSSGGCLGGAHVTSPRGARARRASAANSWPIADLRPGPTGQFVAASGNGSGSSASPAESGGSGPFSGRPSPAGAR